MTPHGLRLGNRRRQLLREAARGLCLISSAETRPEKSARQRAAAGLVKAGLVARVVVRDLDARGRMYDLAGLELTDAGREVARAWWPQLKNGSVIRWARHERLVADAAWRWSCADALGLI